MIYWFSDLLKADTRGRHKRTPGDHGRPLEATKASSREQLLAQTQNLVQEQNYARTTKATPIWRNMKA